VPAARLLRALLGCALVASAGGPAAAESSLRLPLPDRFGEVVADTYDERGLRVGDATLRIERAPGGAVELSSRTGIEGAEHTVIEARLVPAAGRALRPVFQSSRSFDAAGRPLGVLAVDHERGEIRCRQPGGGAEQRLALPAPDRVANVPLNLLFQPLVLGQEERIDFQFVLCRGGPRLLDAHAEVAGRRGHGPDELVEVRYRIDLGPLLSPLAQPFLPRLSVWFDHHAGASWVGHRMPLYSKGPTVVVMRRDVAPASLGLGD
jgi:hypothetical protein